MADDPSEYTVRELRDDVLPEIDDLDELEEMLEAEHDGANRDTAISHIEARLNAVSDDDDDGEDASDGDDDEDDDGDGGDDGPQRSSRSFPDIRL